MVEEPHNTPLQCCCDDALVMLRACVLSACLQVRAGTGGEEAALWAADLIRMYQKYADTQVCVCGAGWCVGVRCVEVRGVLVSAAQSSPARSARLPDTLAPHTQGVARCPLCFSAPCCCPILLLLLLMLSLLPHCCNAAPLLLLQNWKVSLMSESSAESGGYKECVLQIVGDRCAAGRWGGLWGVE